MKKSFILLLLTLPHLCGAQVRINEIMASNVRAFPNAHDFEDYPDWIELHNSSTDAISLSDYYLSDDSAEPRKWSFPTDAIIEAGEYLVIVADGHDTAKGTRSSRSYTGGLNFTTQNHHTNFKLSSAGEDLILSRDSDTFEILEQLSFGNQIDDVSLARDPDNPSAWIFQATPTPGAANAGPSVSDIREISTSPVISPAAGLYQSTLSVEMVTEAGEIRYTTDGTNPSSDSILYTAPFEITATTIIRARVYEAGKVPGEIITRSYFLGENFENGLPYLSIVAPPETLFGVEIGIYGHRNERGGNIHKGVDAPGHLEFFPADGSTGFAVNGGFRLGGENNFLAHAQKAFNFALRGRYGDDSLQYNLFPGSEISTFTALTIREGGDDWGKAHLTDPLFDPITEDRMEAETNRYRPTALFVNGEYWGLYNIRDRWDDNWFFQEYGTNEGEYDHVRADFNRTDSENGTIEDWRELEAFMDNNNLSSEKNWETIESEIEIDSLIDFIICESWGRNSSWAGNREWWKDHRPGSKWRWFLPDMDRTFGNSSDFRRLGDLLSSETTLKHFNGVRQFSDRFVQRAAAHMVNTLSATRVNTLINTLGAIAAPEIPNQLERWGTPSETAYESALTRMTNFVSARDLDYLEEVRFEFFYLPTVELELATSGEGSFIFAGVEIEAQSFAAFPNTPVEIIALPAPGYRFTHWTGADGEEKIEFTFSEATTLTANFVPDSSTEISGELTANTTLTLANSPYIVTNDLIIPSGVTLTIPAGVALEFSSGVNLRVIGTLIVNGSAAEKVSLSGRHGATWGGVSFEEPSTQSTLTHLTLRQASRGQDPMLYPAAIAGLNADLVMDFLDIDESRAPLFFRGGSMILRDSEISIPLTGDGVNVKQGMAETIRCTFNGNDSLDTDAIDYDGVTNGLIKDCRIYDFTGFNSDGIDIGEQCQNCLLEGNVIYYNSDKGISIGQGSSITIRQNLIVGCPLGIAVKDEGSVVIIDQNTIVDCEVGVLSFEKNFGAGGGDIEITNCIFSNCDEPTSVDSFSTLLVSYSLSDTSPLTGPGNLLLDPMFTDVQTLNFELLPGSPAIDAGDPQHNLDPDGTRTDMGANYSFSPDDYPFDFTPTVVINEVLANSGDSPDWLELHNRSAEDIDISGWFLSDGRSNLKKYRIPADTIIEAGAFLTFTEDLHFGEDSPDPGRLEGFALSDTGETLYLSSGFGDQLTSYRFEEDFGPSFEGQTIGFHYKISSDSYDFVIMETATPNASNAPPLVGPIVISEIMYESDIEYLELVNISSESVNLYDSERAAGWKIDQGIQYDFLSSIAPLAPGERLILTENLATFTAQYQPEADRTVLQWTSGKLNNGGEVIQLERPGPLSKLGTRTFVRVDRVNYDDDEPWDTKAKENGLALAKINENEYGNDFINWEAAEASPLNSTLPKTYAEWAASWNISSNTPDEDLDKDNISNLFEYAFGMDPTTYDDKLLLKVEMLGQLAPFGSVSQITFPASANRPDIEISLEGSDDLESWNHIPITIFEEENKIFFPIDKAGFYRLRIENSAP